MDQIFDSCHRHACQRTVGKGRQQLRQVGKVQLNKSGHNRNGEFQKLQRKGNGRQHGNAGKPPAAPVFEVDLVVFEFAVIFLTPFDRGQKRNPGTWRTGAIWFDKTNGGAALRRTFPLIRTYKGIPCSPSVPEFHRLGPLPRVRRLSLPVGICTLPRKVFVTYYYMQAWPFVKGRG